MPLISRQAWTRHLVIPFGNLLGVVLLCLIASPALLIAAITSSNRHQPSAMRPLAALFLLAPIVAVIIDVRWRRRQQNIGSIKRWFSPYEGATIFILPIWLIASLLLLISLVPIARHSRPPGHDQPLRWTGPHR
jgi:hypothetical protein